MSRTIVVVTLALALAHALAPASAQVPGAPAPGATILTVFLVDPGGGFPPGGNRTVDIGVNYGFPRGSAPEPRPTPEVAENTSTTKITLSAVQIPSWVESVEFIPTVVEAKIPVEQQATGGTVTLTALVKLFIKPDAPALTREDLIVAADAAANGNLEPSHGESPPLKIRVEPVGKLNVTSFPSVVIPGGRWTTVPFNVRNEGNSDIVAKLNVTVMPENSEVEFPKTVTIAPGAVEIVEVRVRTPWTNAELGTLTLEAVPLLDGDEGRTASFDVDVRGESAVPGPGLPLALLGLALALLRRRG